MQNIYGLTLEELGNYFISIGDKPYRKTQIFEWLYRHKIRNFDEITNQKKEIIKRLNEDFNLDLLEVANHQISADGTEKFLFKLDDGEFIESVLMRHEYGLSVCVTSELGCNMGCVFCASGMYKKKRNLRADEMVRQIMTIEDHNKIKVGHVVIMGIGEPLDNYENVMSFIRIINEAKGLEIGARHISLSTCGIVPKIYEYAKEDLQTNLAISFHAPNNQIRDQIMPINKVYKLEELMKAIKDYIDLTNRRVTLEYILIKDLNDKVEHAKELAKLIKGLNVYVNLIPYNEVKEKPFKRSLKDTMREFYSTLKKEKINVTLRLEQGSDIDAACGQLRSKKLKGEI